MADSTTPKSASFMSVGVHDSPHKSDEEPNDSYVSVVVGQLLAFPLFVVPIDPSLLTILTALL
jgi:hypothetical protein